MKIYYEDNHIIVVEKKPNQPTQADESQDFGLLSEVREYIRDTYKKTGNVFVGLVHRLDRPVGGIMVFAKTSKAASRLSDQVRRHAFEKIYTAVVMGYIDVTTLTDYMIKDRKTNTSRTVSKTTPGAKFAQLNIVKATYRPEDTLTRVEIELITGRSHQIRVQFASRGIPLWGDARYNARAKKGQQIALWASKLSFDHPTSKERLTFWADVPQTYPFIAQVSQ